MKVQCISKKKEKLFVIEMNSIPSLDIVFKHGKKQYKVIDVKSEDKSYSLTVVEWYSKLEKLMHG